MNTGWTASASRAAEFLATTVDAFLHSGGARLDVRARGRARLALAVLGALVITGAIGAWAEAGDGVTAYVLVGGGVAALAAAITVVLRQTGSLSLTGNALAATVAAALAVLVALGDGRTVGCYALLPIVPMLAVLVAGTRAGLVWGTVALVQLTVAGYLWGGSPGADVTRAAVVGAAIIGSATAVLAVMGLALAYEYLESRAFWELSRTRSQMGERNEALEESNRELDEFAYTVSHDLKAPLRGISTYSNMLLEDHRESLGEEVIAKLERLTFLSRRMDTLINSLLHFSRVGRTKLSLALIPVGAIVTEVVEALEAELSAQNAEVLVASDLPQAKCDKERVAEVFQNLITNAVKYNDKPHKTVEVGCKRRPLGGARIGSAATVFYVRDNGIGIPAEHLGAVFAIFRRLHASDDYGGGAGAGLTIVKRIVERHGGRIWVESREGEGTTFLFTLSGAGDTAAARSVSSHVSASGASARVAVPLRG